MATDFHYVPTSGSITGKSVLDQTERAINELGLRIDMVDGGSGEAIQIALNAQETANNALATAELASNTATAAQERAQAALEAADQAQDAADAAGNKASSAFDIASNAEAELGDIRQIAEEAKVVAEDAKVDADNAIDLANEAQIAAENAAYLAMLSNGVYIETLSAVDLDSIFEEPAKLYLASSGQPGLPNGISVPAYLTILINDVNSSATQHVWSAGSPEVVYVRYAEVTKEPDEDRVATWSNWAPLSGGGGSDITLSDSVTSDSSTVAASSKAVKTANDNALAAQTAANNAVQTSRQINTTAPLTGGGNLSANRTLAINAGGAATATAAGTPGSVVYAPDNAADTVRNQAATPAYVVGKIGAIQTGRTVITDEITNFDLGTNPQDVNLTSYLQSRFFTHPKATLNLTRDGVIAPGATYLQHVWLEGDYGCQVKNINVTVTGISSLTVRIINVPAIVNITLPSVATNYGQHELGAIPGIQVSNSKVNITGILSYNNIGGGFIYSMVVPFIEVSLGGQLTFGNADIQLRWTSPGQNYMPDGFILVSGGSKLITATETILGGNVPVTGPMVHCDNAVAELKNTWANTGSNKVSKYLVENGGVINTFGAGENYIPGTAAGVVKTGGIYV